MGSTVTYLLSIATLPRPTLWAVPSPVVPQGADVTLRCQGHLGSEWFQLWKDGELREERNASWQLAEFVLRNVDGVRDARSYSCRSGQGPWWSELSEPLALVLTGHAQLCQLCSGITEGGLGGRTGAWQHTAVWAGAFPKPSISVSHGSPASPGTTVTITCHMSQQPRSQDYTFALLEAKSLEPLQLQSPAGTRAVFLLPSVRAEDSGSYSCIYYRKMVPHSGSHPSRTLELTVSGKLPKPIIWAQPGPMVVPGANLTLWCSRPKLSFLEEVTFTLCKAGTREALQQQSSAEPWASFLLSSVRPEDSGSYSCAYRDRRTSARGSEPSDALELVVPGSLPKPSLSALPGLVVEPGTHVTLQCRQPPPSSLWGVTFTLMKEGTPQPLQSQSPAGASADFPLLSVRAQDAGNYSCVYQERMAPSQVSEPSEVLEIWVADQLPKPSLSAWPGREVASGSDVTLLCWGPSQHTRFVLYKEGDENILPSMDTTRHGALFFLSQVTPKHSGNYSCCYQYDTIGSLRTQHSDPLQLIVRASEPSNTLLITLSCVSFLLFLLCLLLLALLCRASSPMGSIQEDRPRRFLCCPCLSGSTSLPHQPEAPRWEALYTEVAKERPREPLVSMAEDPQGVTYTQLTIRTVNKRKTDYKKTPTEPILYSTVSRN
ncbi:immunoglobulin superfamily member 1-like [Dromiciops gliroides]|uniref:immunoglobulin superfamily member 1-like n=1 Tax=Dromiciops gliroides TaxID=33562 RepID=UPI001CC82703|nr:immunoglobulin superfamily member 1-like [Dromiciops gliroides]